MKLTVASVSNSREHSEYSGADSNKHEKWKLIPIPISDGHVAHSTVVGTASAWSVSKAKRGLDIALAATSLVLLSPLIGGIAAAIRLSSDGPVFFRQKRMGRNGELFTICKFRTMEEERQGPSHTRSGDRRVTPVGAILRKYKLDEIPQFLNVLRGEMSIVGPRPKLPQHESMHMPFRPGLTGAATLAFRREEELLQHVPEHELEIFYARSIKPLKAHLDWNYMQQSTLKTDLALMLRTVVVCMGMRREEIPDVLTHVPRVSARSAGD